MANYWQPKHQELIEKYYYCHTGITSGQTRNECITQLLPVLEHITRVCMHSIGMQQTTENIQDVLIRISTYQLPKLDQTKLQGAFNFIYISTKRYIINKQVLKTYYFEDIDSTYVEADNTTEADYNINIQDIRKEILDAIDDKIEEQKIINKTNSIFFFLINMKEYIIQNDFDVRGFNDWIQDKMNISKTTYSSIISRVGIRSKIFNEKIIKE